MSNNVTFNITLQDAVPPGSITNLQNSTYAHSHINWTWTDPADPGLSTR